ncbi:MAG: DUF72 domain-containing protein [Planctomycetota bacterium]|nr:DUF72 domain-containing protein [Planctomycetota bacterium]
MIHYGIAGWSYADWAGRVYPRPKPRDFHPLPYLARFLDLIEINSSFYALPRPDHAARWAQLVAPHPEVRFTAKLHQGFTHGALADLRPEAAEAFRLGLAPLAEAGRLLALLVQFPVTFAAGSESWERLERIRALFPGDTLVLELRHRTWFSAQPFQRLERLGYGLAHLDLPAARDHPPADHPSLGPLAYLRLHGRNAEAWFDARAGRDQRYDYRYAPPEIDALAERLRGLAARSEKTLLVANNHFGGQAVACALELKSALTGAKVPAPACLVEAFPDLRACTTPEGGPEQLALF